MLSGLRTHYAEHSDQQLQIVGRGERGIEKEALWLTLDPSGEAALLHFTSRLPQQLQEGERLKEKEEDVFHKREGAEASQTGSTDYAAHLGNIRTETKFSEGAKTFEEHRERGM